MSNRLRTVLTVLTAAATLGLAPAGVQAATQYVVTGHGYGHGIGMSQYGAQGMASKAAKTWSQILQTYFQGVTFAQRPADAALVDVLLTSGKTSVTLEAVSGVTVANGASAFALAAGDRLVTRVEGTGMSLFRLRAGVETRLLTGATAMTTVTGAATATAPVRAIFTAQSGDANRRYRGSMQVHKVGSTLSVVNRVKLDDYLLGVVPAEMSPSWHPEALKAQAVAARSYAVANRSAGIFDMHSDTRSQVYRGLESEAQATNAAVLGTAGITAWSGGKVISAFFHAASGGRTAANEDVWGGTPLPYLRSVADPYEASPYTTWAPVTYSSATMASKLSGYVNGTLVGITVTTNASLRAKSVTVVGSTGSTTITAATFKSRLGLRSTWFRVAAQTV